ncbi:MAG: type I-D CRISPR-associated helicase Cas3', partial [Promethearchaeota archaeon]
MKMNNQSNHLEPLIEMDIPPIYLENSNYQVGEITFRKFQKEFINTNSHWNILVTPTGSGKTLAVLAKLLLNTKSKRGIFVYPTNELINDQLKSLSSLISKLGFKPLIISPQYIQDLLPDWQGNLLDKSIQDKNHVLLIAFNGTTLHDFSYFNNIKDAKGRALFELLNIINSTQMPSILLTNIDTIYLILRNKYKEHSRIFDLIFNWNFVVIDEFHLYSDISLVNLLYSIILYYIFIKRSKITDYSINLLSATPSDVFDLINESFSDASIIKSTPVYLDTNSNKPSLTPKFANIRKNTKVYFCSSSSFLHSSKDMDSLYKLVLEIIQRDDFNSESNKTKNVSLLILLNSMIFTENFYKYLVDKFKMNNINIPVARIHGMINPKKRIDIRKMDHHILIGTRAIEIGVDFDVPFMVFEAFDTSTFLQRLGRGGRHNPCTQFCITNSLLTNSLYD